MWVGALRIRSLPAACLQSSSISALSTSITQSSSESGPKPNPAPHARCTGLGYRKRSAKSLTPQNHSAYRPGGILGNTGMSAYRASLGDLRLWSRNGSRQDARLCRRKGLSHLAWYVIRGRTRDAQSAAAAPAYPWQVAATAHASRIDRSCGRSQIAPPIVRLSERRDTRRQTGYPRTFRRRHGGQGYLRRFPDPARLFVAGACSRPQ